MDGLTSENVMPMDGEGIPGKALKNIVLESLPESRKSGNA